MYQLVIASGNSGKLAEIRDLLDERFQVLGLDEVGVNEEIPETGSTLEANALQKARSVRDRTDLPVVADDTGLEVEALNGEPGVHSARFAGPQRDSMDNMTLLLERMSGVSDRRARFRTVIALVTDTGEHLFEGAIEGTITNAPRGMGGFGYDPVFVPNGATRTFAEMSREEKNACGHRGIAIRALLEHLRQIAP